MIDVFLSSASNVVGLCAHLSYIWRTGVAEERGSLLDHAHNYEHALCSTTRNIIYFRG